MADTGNATIRKITPAGVVTTLAGEAGKEGRADGVGAKARFASPVGIAVDDAGDIYVVDEAKAIRRISPAGEVSTPPALQSADAPGLRGLAIDGAGDLYVTERSGLRKVARDGQVTELWTATASSSDDDPPRRPSSPHNVAVDAAGNVYLTEAHQTRVWKLEPRGRMSVIAGGEMPPDRPFPYPFDSPDGVAVDAQGNVYVADPGTHLVTRIAPTGGTTFFGKLDRPGSSNGEIAFASVSGLAVDAAGDLFVASDLAQSVYEVTPAGVVSSFAGTTGEAGFARGTGRAARFHEPKGLVADPDGNVFVCDERNRAIRKISPSGKVTTVAGGPTSGSLFDRLLGDAPLVDGKGSGARFGAPVRIARDAAGTLYVADQTNHAIRRITPDRRVTTLAGGDRGRGPATGEAASIATGEAASIATGEAASLATGVAASIDRPDGIGVDAAGNVYVAEPRLHVILKVTPDGRVRVLAGAPGESGHRDGPAASARFNMPTDLAVDRHGNVLVIDVLNLAVRRITPGGMVSTVFGGARCAAGCEPPTALAIDAQGAIYLGMRSTVLKIDPDGTDGATPSTPASR